jgi:hypothetical protein
MKKATRSKMAAAAKEKGRGKKKKGVGIGVSNVMWLLEGTDKRYTGTKRVGAHKRGNKARMNTGGKKKYTGRMKRSGYVQKAETSTRGLVSSTIRDWVAKGIAREVARG